MTEESHLRLLSHLVRSDGQEDLCFATFNLSRGSQRLTAIITDIILPLKGDRNIHGNVGFMPQYFTRALKIAAEKKQGIALLHSHLFPGWQGMSKDDVVAETRLAPAAYATTGFPFIGLTIGTDGSWSGRFWLKDKTVKRKYLRHWCGTVKVVGKNLRVTFNDSLLKPKQNHEQQLRTISAWGEKTQKDISRLRIGIVGLGSVGSIVAEILARVGVSNFTLIDFDKVEEKNLDRLTGIFKKDIGRFKVNAIKKCIQKSATAVKVDIHACNHSVCEKEGFEAALNCDVLFCCVDRPWGREVLNFISYAHLIPVIDGGIMVRTNKANTKIIGADWKAQIVGYKRPCLECLGQYKAENAGLERTGLLDDPLYIQGMEDPKFIEAHENVYAFSSHLASMEVLQMLSLFIAPSGVADVGQQTFHFVTGVMDVDRGKECHPNCIFTTLVGKGDSSSIVPYSTHKVASDMRNE
jgi:molybdopterin/thiamine biosynthesis adenylyltransferase